METGREVAISYTISEDVAYPRSLVAPMTVIAEIPCIPRRAIDLGTRHE